jgi:CDP-diacylglycerol--glycerol-3-phosphate 3-phosphatidyltransferase
MKIITIPNIITATRGVLIVVIALCVLSYSPDKDYLRLICAALMVPVILSDILDGKIARKLNQETKLGAILDSVTDMMGFMLAFVFLTFIDTGMKFPLWFASIVVAREIIVYGFFLFLLLKFRDFSKKTHPSGKYNTLVLSICVLALFLRFEYSIFLWVIGAILTVISGVENVNSGLKFLDKKRNGN